MKKNPYPDWSLINENKDIAPPKIRRHVRDHMFGHEHICGHANGFPQAVGFPQKRLEKRHIKGLSVLHYLTAYEIIGLES